MIYKHTKEMLEHALEDVAAKGEITSSNLDIIHKLVSSIKSLDTIEAMEKSSYENNSFDSRPSRNYDYGYDYDRTNNRSYARRRDSMGRYSRDDEKNEIVAELHELKNRVKDSETKRKLTEMIEEMR